MVNVLTIVWDSEATVQLKELYQYIRQDSLQNALSVRNDIIEKIKLAAKYPNSFSTVKFKIEDDGTFRAFEIHRYRISYFIAENKLIILRIRHTSNHHSTTDSSSLPNQKQALQNEVPVFD